MAVCLVRILRFDDRSCIARLIRAVDKSDFIRHIRLIAFYMIVTTISP